MGCEEVLKELKVHDPMLQVAQELERVALQDEYFVKRKLYPNVDYYSGIVLRAIGIPTDMFTVMFAMSRTVGWVSQWNEMVSEGQMRIGRPRQLYVGAAQREYTRHASHERKPLLSTQKSKSQDFSKDMAKKEEEEGHKTSLAGYKVRRATSFRIKVPE